MKVLVSYIAFAVVLGLMSVVFYIDTLKMPKAAAELPRILISLTILLSLLMIAERIWLLRKGRLESSSKKSCTENVQDTVATSDTDDRSRFVRIGVFVAMLFAYVMTIETLGYFITTPLFLVFILSFLKSTKFHYALIIAFGFTGFVYLLFVMLLNLPVPLGLMDFG